jgi:predicted alpha-1,2-mannosidase
MSIKVWFVTIVFLTLGFYSCRNNSLKNDYTKLVDPMIGTGWNGHTFPGATLPNGMVQLSPDTKTRTWANCSGYHFNDKSILGFSHTHYSGTGEGGGADILFMPTTGKIIFESGEYFNEKEDDYSNAAGSNGKEIEDTSNGYRSKFLHKNEFAEPGYYSVLLDDYNVKVELTATKRVGLHKYTFPKTEEANVILDLVSGNSDVPDSLFLEINGDELSGYRSATGALDGSKTIWFSAKFSKSFNSYGIAVDGKLKKGTSSAKGKNVKAYFRFTTKKDEAVLLKVGISGVSIEGARKNLDAEMSGWDFDKVRNAAKDAWNKELNKIEIEGGTPEQQEIFYTALYHSLIHPNIDMDVDRKFRSTNKKIYTATGFDDYTTYSLWDTHRGLHPLQTIINPAGTNQFIRTFIERFEHSGDMPKMEFSGNEAASMIGYHSLPVVADAYVKGLRDYDVEKAFKAMKHLANAYREGKNFYLKYGYIPYDLAGQSVSRTLEYSFDDWCVSRLAKDFNKKDFEYFSLRGQFYKNLFDYSTNFMRPKDSEYQWKPDFDPMKISNMYTEANAYQYTPSVFQDIEGLIKLIGGDKAFENWLDNLFTTEMDTAKLHIPDVTGLIGQYAHGNEPSHHIAYLYNYVGTPWKTQKQIRNILTTMYTADERGISGNEDAGQMSAWYVLSSMGFYSVTPGMDYYVIGSPLFNKVTINVAAGKKFEIIAKNNSSENVYIQSVTKNGEPYKKTYIKHSDIVSGAKFVFVMGDKPNKSWGIEKENRPRSERYESAPMVKLKTAGNVFLKSTKISLSCPAGNSTIRYTLDGTEPDNQATKYSEPFTVSKTCTLKAKCFVAGLNPGYTLTLNLKKAGLNSVSNVRVKPGAGYVYKEGFAKNIAGMKQYPVKSTGVIKSFNLDAIKDSRPFSYKYEGYIKAPADGLYTFRIEANDGAILYIDGEELINNDGGHQAQAITGKVGFKKGLHKIRVDYFQMGRAKKLVVEWKLNDGVFKQIGAEDLFH